MSPPRYAPRLSPSPPRPAPRRRPAPNEVVYVPQLPSAAELSKAAAAQNVTIAQIDQTNSQVTVTYKYSNGAVNTVSYQPLANAENGTAVPMPSSPAPAATAGTTVVYTTTTAPAPAYYYDYPYYGYGYYPWGWYPPVSIGLGFGFHGGGFRGGFHGRFR